MATLPPQAHTANTSPMSWSTDIPPVIFATNSTYNPKLPGTNNSTQINNLRSHADNLSFSNSPKIQAIADLSAGFSKSRMQIFYQQYRDQQLAKLPTQTQQKIQDLRYSGLPAQDQNIELLKLLPSEEANKLFNLQKRIENIDDYLNATDITSDKNRAKIQTSRQNQAHEFDKIYSTHQGQITYTYDENLEPLHDATNDTNLAIASHQVYFGGTQSPSASQSTQVLQLPTEQIGQATNALGKTVQASKKLIPKINQASQKIKNAQKAGKIAGQATKATLKKAGIKSASTIGATVSKTALGASNPVGWALLALSLIPMIFKNWKKIVPITMYPLVWLRSFASDPIGTAWRMTGGQGASQAASAVVPPEFSTSTPSPTAHLQASLTGQQTSVAPIYGPQMNPVGHLITTTYNPLPAYDILGNISAPSSAFLLTSVLTPFIAAGVLTFFVLTVILTSFTVPNPNEPQFGGSTPIYGPDNPLPTPPQQSTQPFTNELSVISWNIGAFSLTPAELDLRIDPIVSYLGSGNYDIIALQETSYGRQEGELIAQKLEQQGFGKYYIASSNDGSFTPIQNGIGVYVLSKYPIIKFNPEYRYASQRAILTQIAHPSGDIYAVSAHPSNDSRCDQPTEILQKIVSEPDNIKNNLILLADMNARPKDVDTSRPWYQAFKGDECRNYDLFNNFQLKCREQNNCWDLGSIDWVITTKASSFETISRNYHSNVHGVLNLPGNNMQMHIHRPVSAQIWLNRTPPPPPNPDQVYLPPNPSPGSGNYTGPFASIITDLTRQACIPGQLQMAILNIETGGNFSRITDTQYNTPNWWINANYGNSCYDPPQGANSSPACRSGYCYNNGSDVWGVSQFITSTFYGASCNSPNGLNQNGTPNPSCYGGYSKYVRDLLNYPSTQVTNRCLVQDALAASTANISRNSDTNSSPGTQQCDFDPNLWTNGEEALGRICRAARAYCGSCGAIEALSDSRPVSEQPCINYYLPSNHSNFGSTNCGGTNSIGYCNLVYNAYLEQFQNN